MPTFMRSPIVVALIALILAWGVVRECYEMSKRLQAWASDPCPRADDWYRGLSRNKEYAVRAIKRWDSHETQIFITDGNGFRCLVFPTTAVPRMPTRITITDEPAYIWRTMKD